MYCVFKGFKAVEWGAEIPDQYSVQELVAAREKTGVSVIGLCTPAGMLLRCGYYLKYGVISK